MTTQNTAEVLIPGLFSTQTKAPNRMDGIKVSSYTNKIYWYAEYDSQNRLTVQPLNAQMVPSGVRLPVTLEVLSKAYTLERSVYEKSVLPKIQRLEGILDKADDLRRDEKYERASIEYRRALAIDEESIRANFGVGLVHLAKGEKQKANEIFKLLLKREDAFEEQHKHIFNEFGISLRKNKMFEEAIEFYGRALQLTKSDENLHINLARAQCELKKFSSCTMHLVEALQLDPGNKAATDFLVWMLTKGFVPLHLNSNVETALQAPSTKPKAQEEESILPDELFS